MPRWFLNKVEVMGGFLGGLSIALPKGLICIIGPRGSGKSTLAEAMRYALSGIKGPSDERYSLIRANLGQSVVTALAQRDSDEVVFTVRRVFGQPATLTGPDGRSVADVDLDRGTFLPIDGYSADRIEKIAVESLGDLRRTLLDELRAEELREIQLKVAENRRSLEANADAIRSVERTISDVTERIEELGDVRARLAALPHSIGDESSAALVGASKQQQANQREAQNLAEAAKAISEFRGVIKEYVSAQIDRLDGPLYVPGSNNSETIKPLDQVLAEATRAIRQLVEQIDNHITAVERSIRTTSEDLRVVHAAQEAEYARLHEKNYAVGAAVRERTAAQQAVVALESLERQRAEAREKLGFLRDKRKDMKGNYLLERERISTVREVVAANLQREAGGKVRVRIARNADSLEYQQKLLGGLKGARVKNHEEIVRSLMRLRPEQLAQIIQDNDVAEFEELTSLGTERCRKILDACRENLDPLDLEIVAIEDKVSIELNVGSSQEPNFKDAAELSSGQKCTALLPLLMARRDTPLIIDQPEDNLDNHFIYETVVDTIRRLKGRRQMIFVTHNANIPVLAEADLVMVLESDGKTGHIAKSGTLDECKDEIIDLLEGGRTAFELRRKRYAGRE